MTLFLDFSLVMHITYSERQETEQDVTRKFWIFFARFFLSKKHKSFILTEIVLRSLQLWVGKLPYQQWKPVNCINEGKVN